MHSPTSVNKLGIIAIREERAAAAAVIGYVWAKMIAATRLEFVRLRVPRVRMTLAHNCSYRVVVCVFFIAQSMFGTPANRRAVGVQFAHHSPIARWQITGCQPSAPAGTKDRTRATRPVRRITLDFHFVIIHLHLAGAADWTRAAESARPRDRASCVDVASSRIGCR